MPLSPNTLDAASHGTPAQADYTYDRDADCFVVTDKKGNELCRTASPHTGMGKFAAGCITDWINSGILIFPTDTPTT